MSKRRHSKPTGRGPDRENVPQRGPAAAREPVAGGHVAVAIAIGVGVTLVLRLLAWLVPTNWLWGFATFWYWPSPFAWALFALAAAGLIPAFARVAGAALDHVGRAWERAGWWADVAFAIAAGLLVYFVRDPLQFPGDFNQRVGLFRATPEQVASILSRSFALDWLVNYRLPMGFGSWFGGPELVHDALLAKLAAGFALIGCRFARAAGARGAALPAAVLVWTGAAVIVHDSGYGKYAPLTLGWALAGLGAVRLARGLGGVGWLCAGAIIGLLSHRAGLLLLPAVAWLLIDAIRRMPPGAARTRAIVAGIAVLAVALLVLPRSIAIVEHVDVPVQLPGGAEAESRGAHDAPKLLIEASNAVNVTLLVVPAVLAGAAAALGLWMDRRHRSETYTPPNRPSLLVPALGTLAAAAFLLLAVRPGSGWTRDWDVATVPGVLILMLVTGALILAWRGRDGAAVVPIASLAMASAIAFWGIHADESIALRRLATLLDGRPAMSKFVKAQWYDYLGTRALNRRRPQEALEFYRRSLLNGPNPRLFMQRGLAFLAAGGRDSARASFGEAVSRDPNAVDAWMELSRMALADGDTAEVVRTLDSVLVRRPDDARIREARDFLAPR